jgi:hypothetical protein
MGKSVDVEMATSPGRSKPGFHRGASFALNSPTATIRSNVLRAFGRSEEKSGAFQDIQREFMNSPHVGLLTDMDSDAIFGISDLVKKYRQ